MCSSLAIIQTEETLQMLTEFEQKPTAAPRTTNSTYEIQYIHTYMCIYIYINHRRKDTKRGKRRQKEPPNKWKKLSPRAEC